MPSQNKKSTPLFIWIILIEVVVILLIITESWMQRVVHTEHGWLRDSMGETQAAWIEKTATTWYNEIVVETGALKATYNFLLPTREQIDASTGAEHLGDHWFPLVLSRLQALFAVLYQMFVRLALMLSWLPFIVIASVPAILDGMMTWRIRRCSFVNTSTVVHRMAMNVTGWSVVALILALFVPLPVSPAFFPIVGIIIIIATVQVTANTQKRI